jgi:hypothetical protein
MSGFREDSEMSKRQMVKIQKDGQEAEVMPSSVTAWERNGWTLVDDESSDEATPAPENPVVVVEDPADDTKE